jgi:hypothetical protein
VPLGSTWAGDLTGPTVHWAAARYFETRQKWTALNGRSPPGRLVVDIDTTIDMNRRLLVVHTWQPLTDSPPVITIDEGVAVYCM